MEATKVLHDNIAFGANTTNLQPTVTNTSTVNNVTTITGDLRVKRASGSFITDGILVGHRVTGTGIQPDTRVTGVEADTLVLSKPATAAGTVTLTFYTIGYIELGLTKGMIVTGAGIPANTVISSVDSETQLTLSANATATGTVGLTARSHIKASTEIFTRGVRVQGARLVAFIVSTPSDADVPTAAAYEFSLDEGVTWRAADATFFSTAQQNVTAGSLVGGRALTVGPRIGSESYPYIIATHMRAKITGHAANQIDSVAVDAHVYY